MSIDIYWNTIIKGLEELVRKEYRDGDSEDLLKERIFIMSPGFKTDAIFTKIYPHIFNIILCQQKMKEQQRKRRAKLIDRDSE
jgi:hypothetical protein